MTTIMLLNKIIKIYALHVVLKLSTIISITSAIETDLKSTNKKTIPGIRDLYACSELCTKNITDLSKVRIVLPIGILKIGHRLELRPVNMYKENKMPLSNTCSFDVIVQILCSTYSDSDSFKRIVQENKNVEICELIIAMINYGIKAKTYYHRVNILSKCLEIK